MNLQHGEIYNVVPLHFIRFYLLIGNARQLPDRWNSCDRHHRTLRFRPPSEVVVVMYFEEKRSINLLQVVVSLHADFTCPVGLCFFQNLFSGGGNLTGVAFDVML